MVGVPTQPAHHLDLTIVAGPQIGARDAREVTHDRIRLPKGASAGIQHRYLTVGIESEKLRRPVLALAEVDVNKLDGRVKILRDHAGLLRI
jgi:hypothetical protein